MDNGGMDENKHRRANQLSLLPTIILVLSMVGLLLGYSAAELGQEIGPSDEIVPQTSGNEALLARLGIVLCWVSTLAGVAASLALFRQVPRALAALLRQRT